MVINVLCQERSFRYIHGLCHNSKLRFWSERGMMFHSHFRFWCDEYCRRRRDLLVIEFSVVYLRKRCFMASGQWTIPPTFLDRNPFSATRYWSQALPVSRWSRKTICLPSLISSMPASSTSRVRMSKMRIRYPPENFLSLNVGSEFYNVLKRRKVSQFERSLVFKRRR